MRNEAHERIDSTLAIAREAWQRSDLVHAEALLRELNGQVPAREDIARLLCNVLRSQGRLDAASLVALELCGASDFDQGVCLRSADFARQCDRHAMAARICDDALARGPATPELLMLAGNVAREAGDFDTARVRYLRALDAGVDLGRHHVLGALANVRRYTDAADVEIAWFAKHFSDTRYSPRSRASAGFALAKAQGDLADYARAARTLRESNAMVRTVQAWNAAGWQAFVASRMRERVAEASPVPKDNFNPVFIVGVPRSGTTLTATLLARATGARDRGELRALRFIGEQLVGGGHLGSPAALTEAASLYGKLAVQDDAPATHYLDQDPLNFRWLHIAAAMFPQARAIHLRRDPRDTALSLWSQDFAHPDMAFAYDFDHMRAYMDGHDALMRHWTQRLSLPIFELDYETLVTETESSLAKLRDFIGAQAAVPEAGSASASVQSASVWQARQPVYATSVGRWQHYAPYVPELGRFKGP